MSAKLSSLDPGREVFDSKAVALGNSASEPFESREGREREQRKRSRRRRRRSERRAVRIAGAEREWVVLERENNRRRRLRGL